MTERTITFPGTITLAEAKRLIAEAEAQPVVEEGRLYCLREAKSMMRWRKSCDGWQASANGGASWHNTDPVVYLISTGALVPYEPEPGVVYRHVETTEQEPHKRGCVLFRCVDGIWQSCIFEWKPFGGRAEELTNDIRYGRRIPYLGYQETPRFTVGQWVQHADKAWTKAAQVTFIAPHNDPNAIGVSFPLATAWFEPSSLRPATDAEIAQAKRIKVKRGMILKHKGKFGRVSRVYQPFMVDGRVILIDLSNFQTYSERADCFTTDHYDILPNYMVEGAK